MSIAVRVLRVRILFQELKYFRLGGLSVGDRGCGRTLATLHFSFTGSFLMTASVTLRPLSDGSITSARCARWGQAGEY
jgi:hypothetical protein